MNFNIPPGLEYLAQLNQVLVQQKTSVCELLSGCEVNNKYILKNPVGEEFMIAKENTDCCARQCCGPIRSFELTLRDMQDQEVIHLYRPLRCDSWCCPGSCLQTIEISCPPGSLIGTVNQEWSCCTPLGGKFVVQNPSGDEVLRIQGPTCPMSCCGTDVVFEVLTDDGSAIIGSITKHWRGLCTEAFTDSDSFGITFPMDLDVRTKALLLGAMFLIDFMYFEKKG